MPEKVGDYTGFYFANRRSFSKFEKLFGLVDMITISGGENGALALSTSGDVKAYFPVAGGGEVFRDRDDNQIAFSRDDRGQIGRIITGHHSYERTTGLKSPIALIAAIGICGFFAVTTLLGSWRRQGRVVQQTKIGKIIGTVDLASGAIVCAMIAALVLMVIDLGSLNATGLLSYPSAAVVWFRGLALLVFFAAAIGVAGLVPALAKSGWSVWRKGHHTVFVLSLMGLSIAFVFWNVIFSPISSM